MRKNFFKKKLATTVALAMVVASLAVPSSAQAAVATKIVKQGGAKAPTVLYVGTKGTDYGLSKVVKGNKYTWTTSNAAIATVNKAGVVTAKAPGVVTVKCTARDSKGKWLKAFTQKLTINLRATSINVGAEDFELAMGEVKDLNAVKTPAKSTDSVRYYSDNTKVATVDAKSGVVKAVGVGEATITVYSKATYKSATNSKYNKTDSVKVTVKDGIQAVKQTTTNKFELTFATDQSEKLTKDNLTLTDADGIKQVVKDISFSTDGKVATVEAYLDFTDGTVYKAAYASTEKSFTASVGAVASIVLGAKTVQYDKATDLDLKAFDKNGVDVSSKVDDWDDVEFDYDDDLANIDWDDEDDVWQINVYDYPKTVNVKATYTVYDDNKDAEVEFTSSAVIKSVKEIANLASSINYTVLDGKDYNDNDDVDWDKKEDISTTLPAEAENYRLFIKAKDQNDDDIYEYNFDSFESSDEDILTVSYDENGKDEEDTAVYVDPVKAGTAYVKAKYGNTTKLLKVTVGSKAKSTKISVNESTISLSDSKYLDDESFVVDVTVKDQYDNEMDYDDPVEVNHKSGDSDSTVLKVEDSGDDSSLDNNQVRFTMVGDADKNSDGSNTFELKLKDKTIKVTVKVADVKDFKVTKVGLEKSASELDVKAGEKASADKNVKYTVYGYNKAGEKVTVVKNAKVTFTFDGDSIKDGDKGTKIEGVDSSNVATNGVVTLTALQLAGVATGEVATQASVGTFKVKAVVDKEAGVKVGITGDPDGGTYKVGGTYTASLKVTNSQTKPTITLDKKSLSLDDADDVAEVIDQALKIKCVGKSTDDDLEVVKAEFVVGSKTYKEVENLTNVELKAGSTVRFKSITINEKLDSGVLVQHKVDFTKSVKITE
ncbi:Ig-like domain-containing protein [Anaerocolumna sp. MB42-C2]|uniref:Ig-like domain-containing protein n=1 Tax=Anaerocolumna sp. MB42-C2 TaxID=3070997 RepID=UPI0027DED384|nr:Ig-like domain-containing protein [Anaerocolumna sp. MB42-C2]WMJ89819.1 Ig-like domain-containing protein [Anaerocolumna sp. MB42-C2]